MLKAAGSNCNRGKTVATHEGGEHEGLHVAFEHICCAHHHSGGGGE